MSEVNKVFNVNTVFDVSNVFDVNKCFDVKKVFDVKNNFDVKNIFDVKSFLTSTITASSAAKPCDQLTVTQPKNFFSLRKLKSFFVYVN